jgi:hypothetical protein
VTVILPPMNTSFEELFGDFAVKDVDASSLDMDILQFLRG